MPILLHWVALISPWPSCIPLWLVPRFSAMGPLGVSVQDARAIHRE